MRVQPARWDDVVTALRLEAEALGDEVAWDTSRVRSWWDAEGMTALVLRDGGELIAYASAAHLTESAFEAILGGTLDPEQLTEQHIDPQGVQHWLGIVITDPAKRRGGAGALVLRELVRQVGGRFVADVYSYEGRKLLEHLGWERLTDEGHPLYVTGG